jgi:2'-5' RNA ligase
MSYPLTEENGRYCVNGKCYDDKADAEKYQAALYANVPDAQNKAASGNRGAMIAFYLSGTQAETLAALTGEQVADPEPPDALHCTLVYLAEDATQIEGQQQALIDALFECAARCTPIVGQINGFGRFFNNEESHALYANVDAWKLPDFRQELVRLARAVGVEPDQTHGFSPHITLAYIPPDAPTPTLPMTPTPIAFGALTLAWGDQHYTFPMGQALQGKSLQVFKQASGLYRWNSLSSGNIQDRDKETITLKALQADVARTKMFGDETSDLTLYHIPYSLGGPPGRH